MLNSKQRAFLRGKANTMEPILQVGKGGISENVIQQADEALKARELIKGKVLKNSLLSAREAADQLAEACGAEVVQVIGNKFVLYRQNREEPIYILP
ncbi:RNA-binding protein [Anoxybacter fermentans]|uniref:RNA-binding protein n=1 Tax=Anoxybacter fermentans TaxID=1323375 RepID=A0A3S9SY56_9FIRM|nr:ribosome assembly RNA-binding protein YhbY [Anoxybacter fermentans]AZR73273.1 RNA-binding protein [Anoxybacter fermentans]